MDIRCKKCNQKYHLSEKQLKDRHIYFNCEKCDYKIIIDMRKERWGDFKPFQSDTISMKNILEGIYFSFNLKNILLSFIILLIYTISFAIFFLIASKNTVFFAEHSVFFGVFSFLFFIVLLFIYDVHLYLISKNVFHRIENNLNILYSSISSEISNDLKSLFFLSIGLIMIFAALMFPVYLMKNWYGVIYEGVFHSINVVLVSVILFIIFSKNILYAFIAFRTRSFRNNIHGIFKFISVENINIPAYLTIINIITFIISSIILFLVFFALFVIAIMLMAGLPGEVSSIFGKLMSQGPGPGSIDSFLKANLSIMSSIKGGMVLVVISTSIVMLFVLAYIINLNQTLSAVSIYIMETNPGRSINKKTLITAILVFIVLGIFMLMKTPYL